MKKVFLYTHLGLLLLLPAFINACSGQTKTSNHTESKTAAKTGAPIDEYVVDVFEDKKGNLWFGTLSKGVARYDGKSLTYLSTKDGLCGDAVVSIAEDKAGNMWFGTHSGLSTYNGKTFTNFTTKEGLCNDRVSHLLFDSAGNLWVGTWGGVCRYNGAIFTSFPLPIPDIEVPIYQATANWVTQIMEDKQGNIWFARSGYGACKYDGASFTTFTQKEGLPSNCVQAMQQDRLGNIWFGTRVAEHDHPEADKRTGPGGLSRYDGKTFMQFPALEGLTENDVYSLCADKKGHIWIGATGVGVYQYDGESFRLYKGTDRMDLTYGFGVQSILADRKGNLWFGFSGGLFRLNGNNIEHVTEESI